MSRWFRLLAVAVLFAIAAVVLQLPEKQLTLSGKAPADPATPATTPPSLTAAQINRQDRVSRAHRRRETRAFDRRPLLAVLPLELAGVRIEIGGLSADGRTTVLTITPGPRGRPYAEHLYWRALSAYGDSGSAYDVRWRP